MLYTKLATSLVLSTTSAITGAVYQDVVGSLLGMSGYLTAATGFGAMGGGLLGMAEMVADVELVTDIFALVHDMAAAQEIYDNCAAIKGQR
jgi:hypothetical protein